MPGRLLNLLRKLPTLLLVAVTALLAARFSWQLFELFSPSFPAPAVAVSAQGAGRQNGVDLAALERAALFGKPPVAKPAARKTPAPAPVRRAPRQSLSVKLVGLVAGEGGRSVAILLEQGDQRAYVAGEVLKSVADAVVSAIEPDHVVIDFRGEEHILKLDASTAHRSEAGVKVQRNAEVSDLIPERIDLSAPAVRAQLGDLRTRLVTDPLSLGRYLQLRPRAESGRLVGYQLFPGRDGRLFRQLGMRPGDLVTHVEGIDVTDPANVPQLLALVQSSSRLRVSVQRGDQTQEVEIDF